MIVGLISDTHGLIRAEALAALAGAQRILHAGDIGDPAILDALERIAPVTAVRGNNDLGAWARAIVHSETLALAGKRVHLLHDFAELAIDLAASGIDVVVSGHSHRPAIERRAGVLYVNPGSAGPRRFTLPVTVARLDLAAAAAEATIVELAVTPPRSRRPS